MKKMTLLAMIMIFAGSVYAQPGPCKDGKGPRGDMKGKGAMIFDSLDEAQQEALHKEKLSHEKTVIPLRAEMKVARMEYGEMITKGENRKKIDKKSEEIAKIREKLDTERTDHLLKVREIVGEDNFKKMHAKMGGRHAKGMGDCGGPCGNKSGHKGGFFKR